LILVRQNLPRFFVGFPKKKIFGIENLTSDCRELTNIPPLIVVLWWYGKVQGITRDNWVEYEKSLMKIVGTAYSQHENSTQK
jgi:hypothetical protein